MGSLDPTPVPSWAVTMWCDKINIYVALPMAKGGVPYIMKYPLSEGGLTSALAVLRKPPVEAPTPTIDRPANYTIPAQPQVKLSKAQEKLHAETTESQRANARALLAKLGIK